MNLTDIAKLALQPGPDKSIPARYITFAFDGKVGVAQAQDLAQMYLAYEEYTDNPRTYDGDFQELFGSLGRDFTRGIIRYAEMADLGDADSTQVFLDGLSALETHLEEDTPLDDALARWRGMPSSSSQLAAHRSKRPRLSR